MKILLVNQSFYPDHAATAQYLTDLAQGLARQGHQVSVLCARRAFYSPHKRYAKADTFHGINIIRVWPFHLGRRTRFLRTIDSLALNIAIFLKLLFLPKADKVVALTSPPLLAWFALWATRLKGSKFCYWIMDLNPDQAIAAGWLSEQSVLAKFLNYALKTILQKADQLIVLDRFMQQKIERKGAPLAKITIIPPWSFNNTLYPVATEQNSFLKRHALQDKMVVMYSGNHSPCHPLDTLLKAANELKRQHDIRFVFVGGGGGVAHVSRFKEEHDLENIIQIPYQSRQELKESLSAASIHVVSMGEDYVGIVHPSKIYGILAVKRPVLYIGPAESPIAEIVAKLSNSYQVQHKDVQEAVSAINATYQKWLHNEELSENNTRLFSQYSQDSLLLKIIDVIEKG